MGMYENLEPTARNVSADPVFKSMPVALSQLEDIDLDFNLQKRLFYSFWSQKIFYVLLSSCFLPSRLEKHFFWVITFINSNLKNALSCYLKTKKL